MNSCSRIQVIEKTRRGKLYWARQGAIIGGFIPYGYCYVPRDGNIRGHVVIDEDKASVVRQMYNCLIEEGLSCRGIAVQLNKPEIPTPKGLKIWRSSTMARTPGHHAASDLRRNG
jgi:hypothetical protein